MNNHYLIGLNFLHSDSSACIFKNGELVAAAEEERFSRIKHTSKFPVKSIKFCLKEAGINLSELNTITINSNPLSSLSRKIFFTLKSYKRYLLALKSLSNIKKKLTIRDLISKNFSDIEFRGDIKYIDHHLSHIASSSFYSNFNESINLSIDGFGDFASGAWGVLENGKISIDKRVFFPHSMGIFYQAITQYLGFKNYGDEYKVMGLSSYGKPTFEKELSKLLFNTKNGYELDLRYFVHQNQSIIENNIGGQLKYIDLFSKNLLELLGDDRKPNGKITQRHIDIAKSAQTVYEKTLFNLLNTLYEKYKFKNLTLSGGCSMNSVANGKILSNTYFEKIYVSPNPGDAGGSIGSALLYLDKKEFNINKYINYAYLGGKYSNNEIEEVIEKKGIKESFIVKKYSSDEINEIITKELCDSKIIGWFQGRME